MPKSLQTLRAPMTPLIQVNKLSKAYRTYKKEPGFRGAVRGLVHRKYEQTMAVNEVSFDIQEGELVGFLGPNGAGKTSTLKMLAGLLYPTSGAASVLGYTPWNREDGYRRKFALLLGQKNQLWWDLPARESLELNSKIYGIPPAQFQRTVDELTALLSVREKLDVMVRELSLGERMKMELIAALLHSPRVLFLDEPTIGLDVTSQKKVREFLRPYNRDRKILTMLTSHYMQDIEELCARVIIIDNGRIFFDGPLSAIIDRFATHKIVGLSFENGVDCDFAGLGEIVERTPGSIRLKVPRAKVAETCREVLTACKVTDLNVEEPPVEEVIRQLFHEQAEATGA